VSESRTAQSNQSLRDFCEGLNRIVASAAFFAFFLFLAGCETIYNPATERKETLLIDTQSEISLGRDIDNQIQKQLKISHNPILQNRLDNIGRRVAKFSDRQDLVYFFRVVEDKELNAFAIPGGFVYVNSGIIHAAKEDELACVLAHEIGHIAARHSVKKLQTSLGYQIIMNIVLGVSGNQAVTKATGIVFELVSLGYSRQDESLADRLAVRYAYKAGFNPNGMVTFLKKLQQEAEKRGPNFNIVFLSSHPPIEERIKNVKIEIEKLSSLSGKLP
jgi:predicted Zn-dependent protease